MSKDNTRPQPLTTKAVWYKSALLPWIIIIVVACSLASFVTGWMLRSEQVTMNDVNQSVQRQLEEVKTLPKE